MNKERYDALKVELKDIRLEADRILIRNYIDWPTKMVFYPFFKMKELWLWMAIR